MTLVVSEIEQAVDPLITVCPQLKEYLCQRIDTTLDPFGFGEQVNVPLWWRVFWLVARNGGWEVGDWGCLGSGGIFGTGLEQNEAIELIQHAYLIQGVGLMVDVSPFDGLYHAFEKFIKMHEAEIGGDDA